MDKYGDFEEVIDQSSAVKGSLEQEAPVRVRLPQQGEFIGIILQRFGGNRMEVQCSDGKVRNCRVPGKFKRSMWLRPRDIVLIKPWIDDNEKAENIFDVEWEARYGVRNKFSLTPEKHTLRFTAIDHEDKTETVDITAGETIELPLKLDYKYGILGKKSFV